MDFFWKRSKSLYVYHLPTGFRGGSMVKNLPAVCSIPGWGRSPGGGHGNLLQDSCLENPTDRGAFCAIIYGVTKSRTRLSTEHTHTAFMHIVKKFGFIVRIYGEGNGFLPWLWWERICLPMQETWVRFLGREDPLEKEMATGSSMAWRSPWTEEPGRFSVHGIARVGHDLATKPNQGVWTG